MSNYSQNTFFAPKDSLAPGDPDKIIQGAEVDPEFSEIETAIATKVDTAGNGLDISGNTVLLDMLSLPAGVLETGDIFQMGDANDAYNAKQVTIDAIQAYLNPLLDHDQLTNYVADQHIAHSGVAITGVNGISGGGDITLSRQLALDINSLTNGTPIDAVDTLAYYDDSGAVTRKITFANFEAAIDPSNLGGDPNQVIDHSTVVLTAGSALAGGGDITVSRSFDVDITEPTQITDAEDADLLLLSDDSDTNINKKITVADAIGVQLGEGRWSSASAQALAAGVPEDVIFGTENTNNLTRGTYSTITGIYTAGASGARLLVASNITADTLTDGSSITIKIVGGGSDVAEVTDTNQADSSSAIESVAAVAVVVLAASASVRITAETSTAEDLGTGAQTQLSIVELG